MTGRLPNITEGKSMKIITCKAVIPADRQLKIRVPEDVPPGPAEVVLVIVPEAMAETGGTAGDFLRSPLFGLWKERMDIADNRDYARELRARAAQRCRE